MYRTHDNITGAIVLHNSIPSIEEVFGLIDKDELELEADEVISYYFSDYDKQTNQACVSTYQQIMKLYSLREVLVEDAIQD